MTIFTRIFKKPYRIFLAGAVLGGVLLVGVAVLPVQAFISKTADVITLPFKAVQTFVAEVVLPHAQDQSAGAQSALYAPAEAYEAAVVNAVKRASPAVVSIAITKDVPTLERCPSNPFPDVPPEFREFFNDQFPQFTEPCEGVETKELGGGSGFIITADGLIVTNKHVVDDSKVSYTVFTNDGKKYPARVVAEDPAQDLAVVKIDASGLPTVALGDSDALQLGQTAIAIGNALGEFRNTVSVGSISGLARTVTASDKSRKNTETLEGVIQTDAAINPGNSGGPLLNLRGEVVGINTAIASDAQNIGFAIPINNAKRDITSVQQTGAIQAAYLGVRYRTITPALAQEKKLPIPYGALVSADESGPGVTPNSPAALAGIQEGDIIYQMDGELIDQKKSLGQRINAFQVGDQVTLSLYRKGQSLSVPVTLTARP